MCCLCEVNPAPAPFVCERNIFQPFFNVSSKDFLKYCISYNFINIFTSLIKLFIFLENLKFYLYYLFVLKNNFKHIEGPKHYVVIYNGMPGGHKGMEVATSHLSKGGQTGQRPVLQKAGFFFFTCLRFISEICLSHKYSGENVQRFTKDIFNIPVRTVLNKEG